MTRLKLVMLTDVQSPNMRNVLHQIYVNIYVEYGEDTRRLRVDSLLTIASCQEPFITRRTSRWSWCSERALRDGIRAIRQRGVIGQERNKVMPVMRSRPNTEVDRSQFT